MPAFRGPQAPSGRDTGGVVPGDVGGALVPCRCGTASVARHGPAPNGHCPLRRRRRRRPRRHRQDQLSTTSTDRPRSYWALRADSRTRATSPNLSSRTLVRFSQGPVCCSLWRPFTVLEARNGRPRRTSAPTRSSYRFNAPRQARPRRRLLGFGRVRQVEAAIAELARLLT